MNKLRRKLKRTNKALRFIYYFILVAYSITLFFFIKNLLAIRNTEPVLITVFIIFFIVYLIIYALGNLVNLIEKKKKKVFITSLIAIIFIFIFMIGSYYIKFVYDGLDNMTENGEQVYKSYLISLKNTEFDNKGSIGMISSDADKNDHNLASKLYTNKKFTNEIKEYDDYVKMIDDLYNGKLVAAFVPGNYITLLSGEEGFEQIRSDTKVIAEYSEKQKNEDLIISSDKDFSEPLTFLLLGVDSENSGLKENSSFNGDTLMLVTFNPKTLDAVMLSIPRDTYVPIACRNNSYAKINSSAIYGTPCVIKTISNFLDIDIDYYVKINFKGVVELVDAIDGIEVDVEKPYFNTYNGQVCEQNSDRLFGDNLVCMSPGFQKLNGEQALAYARNRHLYIGSDLDRIKHQQQVVEAIASKAVKFSSIKDFQKILNAISNNLATNMDTDTILSGYQVVKNMVGNMLTGEEGLNIRKGYLETYNLNVYVPTLGRITSAQGYYESSLEDIKKALKVSLGEVEEEEIKTFSFSINKPYEKRSPGKGKKKGKSGELLPNFVGKSVTDVKKFCEENNIELKIKYVDEGDYYNPNVAVGLIGVQSIHESTLLSTVKELTVYITNSKPNSNSNKGKTESNKKEKDPIKDIFIG